MRFGRCEEKFNVLRRFFECLKQRIKRSSREHVYFINDVDFVGALRWRVLTVVAQFTYLIDAVVRSTIDLDHIHAGTTHDGLADLGFVVRGSTRSAFSIERFSKQARGAGFTRATRPDKQIGVCNTLSINRIA